MGGGCRRWEEDVAGAIGGLKKMKKDTGEKMMKGKWSVIRMEEGNKRVRFWHVYHSRNITFDSTI